MDESLNELFDCFDDKEETEATSSEAAAAESVNELVLLSSNLNFTCLKLFYAIF